MSRPWLKRKRHISGGRARGLYEGSNQETPGQVGHLAAFHLIEMSCAATGKARPSVPTRKQMYEKYVNDHPRSPAIGEPCTTQLGAGLL